MTTLSDTQVPTRSRATSLPPVRRPRPLLEVSPKGGKWWRLKYSFEGKPRLLSLGTYPDTGLKAVREKRDQARDSLSLRDPSAARRAQKASRSEAAINSFEAVAREWHATVHVAQVSAGHAARTLIRLEQDVFPWLGGLPIGDIKPPQLLRTMRRIEARGAIETAHRALQACGQVFRYAIATGRVERDPTPRSARRVEARAGRAHWRRSPIRSAWVSCGERSRHTRACDHSRSPAACPVSVRAARRTA